MKLNQNKKTELLNLHSCSKDLLIWIQLQAFQEDIIEITHKHYTEDVKVSLNTFKKALGGLLDNKILFATSKKGKFKLNKDFIVDSYFYNSGLGDFKQHRVLSEEESELFIQQWMEENNKSFTWCSNDKENTFTVKNYPKSTVDEAIQLSRELREKNPDFFDPTITLRGFQKLKKEREELENKLKEDLILSNLELQEEESKLK